MVSASASRLLLLGTASLTGAVLAFLIGARAGSFLDRAMTQSASHTTVGAPAPTGAGMAAAMVAR